MHMHAHTPFRSCRGIQSCHLAIWGRLSPRLAHRVFAVADSTEPAPVSATRLSRGVTRLTRAQRDVSRWMPPGCWGGMAWPWANAWHRRQQRGRDTRIRQESVRNPSGIGPVYHPMAYSSARPRPRRHRELHREFHCTPLGFHRASVQGMLKCFTGPIPVVRSPALATGSTGSSGVVTFLIGVCRMFHRGLSHLLSGNVAILIGVCRKLHRVLLSDPCHTYGANLVG